jgi:uncharacterized MAPEG superfamily protein
MLTDENNVSIMTGSLRLYILFINCRNLYLICFILAMVGIVSALWS